MKNPLVTVLLPVYNNEDIYKAINSVLAQSFRNFELLIIDNASTDNTVNVIKSFADQRIRLVINKKNIGPTGSLNKGVNLAKGKYIARIDADDLMLPTRLEKQVEFMDSHEDYGIVGSWTTNIDGNDQLLETNYLCTTDKGIRAYLNIQSPFYHPAVMLRKSVLEEHCLNYNLNIKVAVEYELWNSILKYSKGCNLPEVLTYYRVGNSNSLTAKNASKRLLEYLSVRETICIENNQKRVLKSLQKEKKLKKNILDCFVIFNNLMIYLHENLTSKEEDDASLKSCVYSRIYESIAVENDSLLGKTLGKIMKLYKR